MLRSIVASILILCVSGCATNQTKQSTFTADTVNTIKVGMTKSDVTKLIGEPRSRSVDNDGSEIWQYRKNAQEGKGVKLFADVTSLGLTRGVDAEYQDILSVSFKNDLVLKANYQENVHNLAGLGK